MRHYLILALLFISSACHNQNSTSKDPSVRKMPFEASVFLSIPHEAEQSFLRRKLLNTILNEDLQKNNSSAESRPMVIGNEDQFKFVKGNYKFSFGELSEYKNAKANSAEVIVSYNDHLDIFFVPQGINHNKAFQQLALSATEESHLFWVDNDDNYLLKNKTYYIVDASKKELKDNDIFFNYSKSTMGEEFNEKVFSFSSNQIVKLKINVSYFKRETALVLVTRKYIPNQTNCDWEAQTCGPCSFEIETPGQLIQEKPVKNDLVDLDIIINGRSYQLSEFISFIDPDGNISAILDLKKIVTTDVVSIEFRQNAQLRLLKQVIGIHYSGACMNEVVSNVIDVTPLLKLKLSAIIFGRKL